MRVLYLHPAPTYGGASKSLIELYQQLRDAGVKATVLTPAGSASLAFAQAQMETVPVMGLSQFDNTRFGHYRRLRWLIVLRELFLLPPSIRALWAMRRRQFDLIHVNDVTLLPMGLLAKHWLKRPLVVHVRSLQRGPGVGWRSRWITALLRRHTDAVIAIDQTVANTLAAELHVTVVHNGLNLDSAGPVPATAEPLGKLVPTIAMLGVLVRMKGVYEFVEAARILVNERAINARFVLAGENARQVTGLKASALRLMGFSEDVRAELERRIEAYDLQDHVHLLGLVKDVRQLLPSVAVVCFPSHLDAAGRPVFEAAWFGIPTVVAVTNPEPDAIVHGVTGLAIPRPDPVLLADALERLIVDEPYRLALGRQGKLWAGEHFSIAKNAAIVVDLYRRLIDADKRRRG